MSQYTPFWPPERIRDQYEESIVDGVTVGTIRDPDNEDAWIQSSVVERVDT